MGVLVERGRNSWDERMACPYRWYSSNGNGCTSRKGKEFLRRDFLKDAVTATHCTLSEGCARHVCRVKSLSRWKWWWGKEACKHLTGVFTSSLSAAKFTNQGFLHAFIPPEIILLRCVAKWSALDDITFLHQRHLFYCSLNPDVLNLSHFSVPWVNHFYMNNVTITAALQKPHTWLTVW